MTSEPSNHVAALRKTKGLTQQELADRLGVHFVTISKLERGKMQLTQKWIEEIARALDVHPGDVFAPPALPETLYIHGGIRNGAVTHYPPKGRYLQSYHFTIEDPDDEASIWLGVADDTMRPFFHWGDAIRFTSYYTEEAETSIGRVVFITADDERHLIGVLDAFRASDDVDIRAFNGMVYTGIKAKIFRLFTAAKVRQPNTEPEWIAEFLAKKA